MKIDGSAVTSRKFLLHHFFVTMRAPRSRVHCTQFGRRVIIELRGTYDHASDYLFFSEIKFSQISSNCSFVKFTAKSKRKMKKKKIFFVRRPSEC
jgi:hypothetical protein